MKCFGRSRRSSVACWRQQAFDLPKDYLKTYESRITAVTPEDVREAAGLLVTPGQSVLAVAGDWPAVKEQLKDYQDVTIVDVEGRKVEE